MRAPHSLGLRLVISVALGTAVRQHIQLCFSTSSCRLLLELLQSLRAERAPGLASTFGRVCLSPIQEESERAELFNATAALALEGIVGCA